MRAFAIDAFGERVSTHDVAIEEPGPGQVRVKIVAAAINPFDGHVLKGALKDRLPHEFPLIPCSDLSGTVDAIGEGVDAFKSGDAVFGQKGTMNIGRGTLAEYSIASTGTIAHRPAFIDNDFGAALPLAGISALQCVESMHLQQGQVVVILGAGGGIGGFSVMMAKSAGATVVGVASSANADYVQSLGADDVVDYSNTDVVEAMSRRYPNGINCVLRTAGDPETAMSLAALVVPGGYVVSMGRGLRVEELEPRQITGINLNARPTTEALEKLASMVKAGELKRPAIKTFRLEDAGAAFDEIGTGHVRGKLVVQV